MRTRFVLPAAILFSLVAYVHPATAAEDSEVGEDAEASTDDSESDAEPKASDEEGKDSEGGEGGQKGSADAAAAEADELSSPVERPGKTYRFVGLRYRGIIVPEFMFGVFGADGGTTVYAHSFGPEFAMRKDNFEYNFALTYTGYGMDPTPIKSSSDPEDAWEIVESQIKVLYLTADFLWSHDFTPEVAVNYGIGAGFGIVWGDLIREQAYPDPNGPGGFSPCVAPGNPNPQYCGTDNDHYNNFTEPSWADGGSKPIIMPWLAVQTGLRYKPHRNFVGRLDLGIGLGQFFFGIGADYGL
jgi:hypothetical protein